MKLSDMKLEIEKDCDLRLHELTLVFTPSDLLWMRVSLTDRVNHRKFQGAPIDGNHPVVKAMQDFCQKYLLEDQVAETVATH